MKSRASLTGSPGRRALSWIVSVISVALLLSGTAIPARADDGSASAVVWATPPVVYAGQPVIVRAQVNNVQAAWLENVPVVNNYAQLVDYPCASRVYALNVQYRDGSFRSEQTQVNVQGTCGASGYPYYPYYVPGRVYPGLAAPLAYSYYAAPYASVWTDPSEVYSGQPVTVRAQVNNVQAAWLEDVPVVNNYAQLVDYPCRTRTYTLNVQYRDGSYRAQQTPVQVLHPTC
jgi:hypothetical protein